MKNLLWLVVFVMGCSVEGPIGRTGPKGDKGDPGIPGTSCLAQTVIGGVNILCGNNAPVFVRDGTDGVNGNDGSNGTNGNDGANGAPGIPGTGCTVTVILPSVGNPTGGAQVTCGLTSAIIINGASSAQAAAYNVVETIDPCLASGGQDEVFLRTASGKLIALFVDNASALTARLSYINDGVNYQTTDSQHCLFSVATDGLGVRTITWTSPVSGSKQWQTY